MNFQDDDADDLVDNDHNEGIDDDNDSSDLRWIMGCGV